MLKFLAIAAVVIAVAVVGILIFAATKPDSSRVERTASIKAPPEKIYPLAIRGTLCPVLQPGVLAIAGGVLVAGLAVFFQRTKTGRALRAVADDHAAAQSVGIPIWWIWFVVWLVAGWLRWSRRPSGHQPRRAVFDHRPRLEGAARFIIGGLTSVPGAIVGGLIVGAGEKIAEGFSAAYRRRHRILVRLRAGACRAAGPAAGPVWRTNH